MNGNIRDTLSFADSYCNWYADKYENRRPEDVLHEDFIEWLSEESSQRVNAVRGYLTNRSWRLFEAIAAIGGQCSPGAFEDFDFNTQQGMRTQVLKLEAANLVKSVRDEEDNRRKTIIITSNGWMVRHAKISGMEHMFYKFFRQEDIDQD